ncbi:ATP-NAD kinase [Neocallimastix lanati (nom. inval.)]|uniref:ATP-NAD kinase n=1 Tax=Neocallimastix californiae TaxID=1754190 RepID=A0A1Y2F5G3_9FUNG|nr:ATP-NAD kinase [Neocallimastix sp. JGI-2020a]ORY79150.1 ATP-NAD kinase [Neocallimastix californiae]|eukprot:ORY79150.1 ATP-NAD kinase [Neocallimastix californiae]
MRRMRIPMDSSFDPSIFNAPITSDISLTSLSQSSINPNSASLNITEMSLKKLENPKSVMIISKAQDNYVIRLTQQLVYWLVMSSKTEGEIKASREIHIYIDGNLAQNPIFNYEKLLKIHPDFRRLLHFWTPQFCQETPNLYDLIDFIVTLGGDGTVLYASWLFQNSQVPPVIPIHMGSLGFFTVFNFNYVFNILSRLLSPKEELEIKKSDDIEDNKSDGSSSYPCYLNNFQCKASPFVGLENYKSSSSEEFYSEDNNRLCFNNRVRFECTVWRCAKRKGADDPELIAYKQKQRERKRIQLELDRIIPIKTEENEKEEDVINQFKNEYKTEIDNRSDELFAGPENQRFENISEIINPGDNPALLSHPCKQQLSYIQSPSFIHNSKSDSHYKDRYSRPVPTETFQILNDVVVDRGPSAYMSHMELYGDNRHLTTAQADGLVVATPTGSTAYSLSAGGPIVHPEVQTMIVTPICPHTLSFRPMLLPNNIELKIMVPKDSRNTAWASFDGRHRIELKQGDFITVTSSRYPMPTICLNGQSNDWFNSLRRCLKWNDRVRQKAFSSSDNYIPKPVSVSSLKTELDESMKSIMENALAHNNNQINTGSNNNGEGSESLPYEDISRTHPMNSFLYSSYDPTSRFSDNDLLFHFNPNSFNQKDSNSLGAKVSYHDIGFV